MRNFHERAEAAIRAMSAAAHVRVETRGGDHVTLWGTVRTRAELEAVERAAWAVPGVCNVDNNVTIEPERKLP